MIKKCGIVCLSLGIVCVLGALGLFEWNAYQDKQAGLAAQSGLYVVQEIIATAQTTTDTTITAERTDTTESTDASPSDALYLGYLALPTLGLELPVLSDWSYDKLQIAPCRQFGTVETNDLVLAGHNYQSHFGTLNQLQNGDTLTFTDMNGTCTHYTVALVEQIEATAVDQVENSTYDLVLYTCTVGGAQRVAVFCTKQL